jgi:hypothetical protein
MFVNSTIFTTYGNTKTQSVSKDDIFGSMQEIDNRVANSRYENRTQSNIVIPNVAPAVRQTLPQGLNQVILSNVSHESQTVVRPGTNRTNNSIVNSATTSTAEKSSSSNNNFNEQTGNHIRRDAVNNSTDEVSNRSHNTTKSINGTTNINAPVSSQPPVTLSPHLAKRVHQVTPSTRPKASKRKKLQQPISPVQKVSAVNLTATATTAKAKTLSTYLFSFFIVDV